MSLIPFALDPFFGDDFFHPLRSSRALTTSGPQLARGVAIDVSEDKSKFLIKADIPGVNKEDIKVTTEGDTLSLSVEKTEEKKEEDPETKFHRFERSTSFVSRSVRLPKNADLAAIKANYKDGVLSLEVPKHDEKEIAPRRIAIN
ncbi:hypothetical protein ACKKBG_A05660 [Auxenochlorella protothecoides x Auxenochlorella symbiontica]|uniref:17.6 kDa class I heat shock protein 3 n=2 Tax=Auxenochlorella protothecoides TaxID=3075 RepID=A0A087SLU2_AUXPR|nr:17.6 kDa class I heat shock protein 3 [Auxenochlorella protothecoides]KFM26696.1 17.6 kDa class I heat shock protein 3 [Auxenochlorella protothecoides]RMZ53962.1 hypothetical protein APUTEX25_002539 [Auxenochlorella protothecoides]|eukprot:RMZ53962.1 hypothetical protein APUTEX25_002539 [Auxenochlorella protothecoides]